VRRLARAGFHCRDADAAWPEFARLRARYAAQLNQLAKGQLIVPAQWIGDRSYLPHQGGRGRRGTV
jgi:small ligand-binding sensory domain FIST